MMTNEQKIKLVLEYFNEATNKDNPLRGALSVSEEMYGTMFQKIQSYDLMDNQKYIKIEKLLSFMRETFGYNEDIS
jgi:hypothetical protein